MSNVKDLQPTMGDLLQKVASPVIVDIGQTISGEIIFVSKHQVLVEVENIGIGIVRGKEIYNEEYLSKLKIGESVKSIVIDLDNELGMLELSFRAIGRDKVWEDIQEFFETGKPVEAKIRDINRGGFLMKVQGVDAFLPASLLSPAHAIKQVGSDDYGLVDQMKSYLGHTFIVKIISVNKEADTMIVSEKAYSDEEAKIKLQKYKIGDVISGSVVGVVDFGIFIRFDDDLEGLVHISEIAWKKVEDPRKFFKLGDQIKAKIVDIDDDNRVNLSVKQLLSNPWVEFAKNTQPGDPFVGKVTKIVSYGAIVVNDEDIQGLCHISQVSENKIDNPAKIHDF
jgi:small subunit ribosomal protein S1